MKETERTWDRWKRRLAVVGALLAMSGSGGALGGAVDEPMALRGVMRELGEQMQAVTDGISREDYEVIERSARAIDAFQWLQSNCYGCHREFRGDFVRHFYGTP